MGGACDANGSVPRAAIVLPITSKAFKAGWCSGDPLPSSYPGMPSANEVLDELVARCYDTRSVSDPSDLEEVADYWLTQQPALGELCEAERLLGHDEAVLALSYDKPHANFFSNSKVSNEALYEEILSRC